jgi:hypothetical protein
MKTLFLAAMIVLSAVHVSADTTHGYLRLVNNEMTYSGFSRDQVVNISFKLFHPSFQADILACQNTIPYNKISVTTNAQNIRKVNCLPDTGFRERWYKVFNHSQYYRVPKDSPL